MTEEFYRWLLQLIREDKMVKFYQSKQWRSVRAKRLKLDHNECQRCKLQGKYTKAKNVHHKKEVKKFPELALELENTESLCIVHHNEEHDRYVISSKKKQTKLENFKNFDPTERW